MKGQDLRDALAGVDRNAPVFSGEREVIGATYDDTLRIISLTLAPVITAKVDEVKKDEVKK